MAYADESAHGHRLVSLDNGQHWFGADEIDTPNFSAVMNAHWDALVQMMDDDARERVHAEFPDDEANDVSAHYFFLRRYLAIAPRDLCIG